MKCCKSGLHIIHDMLLPIKKKYPEVSYGDLWALAGAGEKKMLILFIDTLYNTHISYLLFKTMC
jgi:hypothetical protein